MGPQLLEWELLNLLGGDEKARVAARYCGFDGRGGATLHAVGVEFGLTGERVRQIVGEVATRHGTEPVAAPALREALSFIAARSPGLADEIEEKLHSAQLSARAFRVEGIVRAAELFGCAVPFHVTDTRDARLVHCFPPESLDAIVIAAHRAIERWGATSLAAILTAVRKIAPQAADARVIRTVLAGQLRWLDPSQEWFWIPSLPRNPLVRRIRKILSVVNPVRAADLRAGILRDDRLQDHLPSPAVLQELWRQLPGVRVSGESIEASPRIDPRETLGEVERSLVDILAKRGGVVRRAELAAVCLQRGISRSSFYSAAAHSPVLAPYPGARLGLLGAACEKSASPGPAAKLRSRYLRSKARPHSISLRKWIE